MHHLLVYEFLIVFGLRVSTKSRQINTFNLYIDHQCPFNPFLFKLLNSLATTAAKESTSSCIQGKLNTLH